MTSDQSLINNKINLLLLIVFCLKLMSEVPLIIFCHSTTFKDISRGARRVSAVGVDILLFPEFSVFSLVLTCSRPRRVRILNNPYTMGFMHEFVQANKNNAF